MNTSKPIYNVWFNYSESTRNIFTNNNNNKTEPYLTITIYLVKPA